MHAGDSRRGTTSAGRDGPERLQAHGTYGNAARPLAQRGHVQREHLQSEEHAAHHKNRIAAEAIFSRESRGGAGGDYERARALLSILEVKPHISRVLPLAAMRERKVRIPRVRVRTRKGSTRGRRLARAGGIAQRSGACWYDVPRLGPLSGASLLCRRPDGAGDSPPRTQNRLRATFGGIRARVGTNTNSGGGAVKFVVVEVSDLQSLSARRCARRSACRSPTIGSTFTTRQWAKIFSGS